jgi:hypothetical protein
MEINKEETHIEKKLKSIYNKERNERKYSVLINMIDKRVLKTQIKADREIKEAFKELYPEEFKVALEECIKRYGATPRREVRRAKVIEEMNIKKRYKNRDL